MWIEVIVAILVIIVIAAVFGGSFRSRHLSSVETGDCSSNWAEEILDKHSSINTHGNSAKTRILLISTDIINDKKLVNEVLKKDKRTDKVTFHILPQSDTNTTSFIDKVKKYFRPTIILMSPQNQTVYEALCQEVLIIKGYSKHPDKFGFYNLYDTVNISIVEPVILTFSVEATTGKAGEILRTMLKENNIPNDPSTRVLWIDGSHGDRKMKENVPNISDEEYKSVGGESGLTYERYLNSCFYEQACQDVGIQAHPSHFDSEPSKVLNVCTKGDFIQWSVAATAEFSRPDINLEPVVIDPLPPNALLNDDDLKYMKITVLDIGSFYNRPDLRSKDLDALKKRREEFLKDVEHFNPTVIFIGWCYSANGDVALALRSSQIFPSMLCEHDLKEISGDKNAKLDEAQKKIIQRMTYYAVRHCIFTGASGSAKSLFAAEFTKKTAAKIVKDNPSIDIEIVVCKMWIGKVKEDQLYQVWEKKYFHAVQGFHITYMNEFSLCRRFNVNIENYRGKGNKKDDHADLINAVCGECERINKAKQDNRQTIFLFDEVAAGVKNGVSDYTQLSKLDKLSSVSTVTCINPFGFGGASEGIYDFTVDLPESCPIPCNKNHGQNCIFSTKLNILYRNNLPMRKFLQFSHDHHRGLVLLSQKDDVLGENLPPCLVGEKISVTWVQCATKDGMENAAKKIITKIEQVDDKVEIVILFNMDNELCNEVASKFKGRHKVFDYDLFFGCESDVILYFCNGYLDSEPLSRGKKKLYTISGPDMRSTDQDLLKLCSADEHCHTSAGIVKCRDEPCKWSDGWKPLVEHLVICSGCGEMMERRREICSHCNEKYEEPKVFIR